MKLQLLSDLHLEFEDYHANIDLADVIILAGDIHVGNKGISWIQRLTKDKPVLYVMGNHEYYGQTYPKLVNKLKGECQGSNIHILEKDTVVLDGVSFHGATLWTNFELFGEPKIAGFQCQQVMSDYRRIRIEPNYSKIRSLDLAMIHASSMRWLKESLSDSTTEHNVVITHHAPSPKSIPEHRRDNLISAAYASDLESFIDEHSPDLWCHGHVHNSVDYQLGKCRVVCNPRGYPDHFNEGFDPQLLVTLGPQKS